MSQFWQGSSPSELPTCNISSKDLRYQKSDPERPYFAFLLFPAACFPPEVASATTSVAPLFSSAFLLPVPGQQSHTELYVCVCMDHSDKPTSNPKAQLGAL
jgi:hypothetical protein